MVALNFSCCPTATDVFVVTLIVKVTGVSCELTLIVVPGPLLPYASLYADRPREAVQVPPVSLSEVRKVALRV